MNLIETLATGIGPRTAGSEAAGRAADAVADAFRELGLEPRFQEFPLVGYEADEPLLEVEGERWDAGPCQYAHDFDGEGTVKRIGEAAAPVGEGMLPNFAIVDTDGVERARLLTSPFSTGAIPFMSVHQHITTPPTAFVSRADSVRLEDGMRVRLRVGGRFLTGRAERNVVADLGSGDKHVLVGAHYDSVWRGPGAIDNASGVEGVRRIAEAWKDRDARVRFVAFAAEEIKLTGSRYYVDEAKLRGELANIKGVVNLDCIARGDQLHILASPESLLERAKEHAQKLGLLDRYPLETGPATGGVDSHWFAENKVDAVTVLHFPYDQYHLTTDTPALVDEQQFEDAIALALALVELFLA
jgi:Peptidase family M28